MVRFSFCKKCLEDGNAPPHLMRAPPKGLPARPAPLLENLRYIHFNTFLPRPSQPSWILMEKVLPNRTYKYFEQLTRNRVDQIQYLERLVYKGNQNNVTLSDSASYSKHTNISLTSVCNLQVKWSKLKSAFKINITIQKDRSSDRIP